MISEVRLGKTRDFAFSPRLYDDVLLSHFSEKEQNVIFFH